MKEFCGITRVEVRGFRGAGLPVSLEFGENKKFIILFGDNGSGKSTLVDAIDFAMNESKGSLGDLSSTTIADLASKSHQGVTETKVCWKGGERSVRLERSKPIVTSVDGSPPRLRVLRRPRLAAIVNATPKERYDEIFGSFFEIPGVTRSEQQLDEALKESRSRLRDAASSLAEAERRLFEIWSTTNPLTPGSGENEIRAVVAWARDLPSNESLRAQVASLRAMAGNVASLEQAAVSLKNAEEHRSLAEIRLADAEQAFITRADMLGSQVSEIYDILIKADILLQENEGEFCPLCEQVVDSISLRQRIRERVVELRQAGELRSQLAESRREFERTDRERIEAIGLVATTTKQLEALMAEDTVSVSATLRTSIESMIAGEVSAKEVISAIEEGAQALERQVVNLELARRSILEYDRASFDAKDADVVTRTLQSMLEILQSERKAYVEGILDAVDEEVNRLYSEVHPGENIALGNIRHRLDQKKRGSLLQYATFASLSEVPPQGCYSESHLLTLALCLWLALAKREAVESTVLVLDDVITAIDAPHTQRLAALLATEACHFAQVILTTHSRRLLRYLRTGPAPTSNLDVRTVRWNLEDGVSTLVTPDERDALAKDSVAGFPERDVSLGRARRVFEGLLRQLTVLYRRRVPLGEPTEPTLGELYDAWPSKHARRITLPNETTLDVYLAPLRSLAHVRNLIEAHVNTTEGDEVPDVEVVEFCQAVHELATNLLCPKCGQLPSRDLVAQFSCSCKEHFLRPGRLES